MKVDYFYDHRDKVVYMCNVKHIVPPGFAGAHFVLKKIYCYLLNYHLEKFTFIHPNLPPSIFTFLYIYLLHFFSFCFFNFI